jgi:hypothetical protein
MLDIYISGMENDLFPLSDNERNWYFYEWTEGLGGDFNSISGDELKRLDAPLNLFYAIMLKKAVLLCDVMGDRALSDKIKKTSESLKKAIHKTFWNNEKELYVSYVNTTDEKLKNNYAELTQALALYANVCPEDKKLRERLADKNNCLIKISLSHSIFKYEALLQDENYAKFVFDEIAEVWGNMLYRGATSFWETELGARDFANAGSLCHGWSAIPVYLYYAYALGIKPTEIGFEKYSETSVKIKDFKSYGIIPTPKGNIMNGIEK